jgi:hypothetical protein
MNINYKVKEISRGGIPGYNKKINEMAKCLNWLMGMRAINGDNISESATGPIINLSNSATTSPTLVGTNANFVGTTRTNNYSGIGAFPNPFIYTFSVGAPITIPTTNPAVYMATVGSPTNPYLVLQNVSTSLITPVTVSYNLDIDYDGNPWYSTSGSWTSNFSDPISYNIPLSATGWTLAPSGLAGFSRDTGLWVYPYTGTISASTTPNVTWTFTASPGGAGNAYADAFEILLWGFNFTEP